ncbi:MAG: hypothetical protein AAF636_17860, partial [Pseudomonadota bacterium]
KTFETSTYLPTSPEHPCAIREFWTSERTGRPLHAERNTSSAGESVAERAGFSSNSETLHSETTSTKSSFKINSLGGPADISDVFAALTEWEEQLQHIDFAALREGPEVGP